jgi:uncharacterized protein DUF4124
MRFLIIALLLAIPAVCSAEIYKWVDEKGQTGYADDLGKVPKKYRDKAATTEKQEQPVEIIEKSEPDKSSKKGGEVKGDAAGEKVKGKEKEKDKGKPLFDGKSGEEWKQDFARLKYDVKSLEDQSAGIKERMADAGKISRGEYLSLQNTQRDLAVRIAKAKKKLDSLNEAAEAAGVPAEFR